MAQEYLNKGKPPFYVGWFEGRQRLIESLRQLPPSKIRECLEHEEKKDRLGARKLGIKVKTF